VEDDVVSAFDADEIHPPNSGGPEQDENDDKDQRSLFHYREL
jgi:hypothetical protein